MAGPLAAAAAGGGGGAAGSAAGAGAPAGAGATAGAGAGGAGPGLSMKQEASPIDSTQGQPAPDSATPEVAGQNDVTIYRVDWVDATGNKLKFYDPGKDLTSRHDDVLVGEAELKVGDGADIIQNWLDFQRDFANLEFRHDLIENFRVYGKGARDGPSPSGRVARESPSSDSQAGAKDKPTSADGAQSTPEDKTGPNPEGRATESLPGKDAKPSNEDALDRFIQETKDFASKDSDYYLHEWMNLPRQEDLANAQKGVIRSAEILTDPEFWQQVEWPSFESLSKQFENGSITDFMQGRGGRMNRRPGGKSNSLKPTNGANSKLNSGTTGDRGGPMQPSSPSSRVATGDGPPAAPPSPGGPGNRGAGGGGNNGGGNNGAGNNGGRRRTPRPGQSGPVIVRFSDEVKRQLIDMWEAKARQQPNNSRGRRRARRYREYAENIRQERRPGVDRVRGEQTEVEVDFLHRQIGGQSEVAYINGRRLNRRKRGSTVPDHKQGSTAFEDKNYDVSSDAGLSRLKRELARQVGERREHVDANVKQQALIIDTRGQNLDQARMMHVAREISQATGIPAGNIQIIAN